MEHDGQEFRMEDIMGMKPVVTFNPEADFRFAVRFDMVSSIERVFIVSTRNNVAKFMEAVWSESAQAYIAQGRFDPADHNYVPGTISVEYVRAGDEISFDAGIDFTSDEIVNQVPEAWKDAEVTIHEDTENKTDATIELPDGNGTVHVVTEQQNIPSNITPESAGSHEYTAVTDDYGNTVHMRTEESAAGYVVEVLDWANEVLVVQIVETMVEDVPGVKTILNIKDFAGTILDGAKNELELEQMRQNIINSSKMTAAEKQDALDQIDRASKMNAYLSVARFAGVALGVVVTTSNPVMGFLFGVAMKSLDRDLKSLMDKNMNGLNNSKYHLLFGFGWAVVPSGYVYDVVTEARLPGVTVTAYWIPYDDEVENFWDAVPDDEYGQFWDASEYSQLNSLVTDAEGRYAWDVPEGWWRVEYVLDGYETTWSEWLPVPPPQTEVNIGMTPVGGGTPDVLVGDVDNNDTVDADDAIYLLYYTLFGDALYPLNA